MQNFSWSRYISLIQSMADLHLIWLFTALIIGIVVLRKDHGSFLAVGVATRNWFSQKLFWTELAKDLFWVLVGALILLTLTSFIHLDLYGNGAGHHNGLLGFFSQIPNFGRNPEDKILLSGVWPYVFILSLIVVGDFGKFWIHRMMHRKPWLWHFHKLHHRSVRMTPLSVIRSHPVMIFLYSWSTSIAGSLIAFPILYFFRFEFDFIHLQIFMMVILGFYLANIHLQHTHIWLSFGPTMNRLFISPAAHQIHHSQNPAHHNKNFGFIFSAWDTLYGSAHHPDKKENLTFGLREDA